MLIGFISWVKNGEIQQKKWSIWADNLIPASIFHKFLLNFFSARSIIFNVESLRKKYEKVFITSSKWKRLENIKPFERNIPFPCWNSHEQGKLEKSPSSREKKEIIKRGSSAVNHHDGRGSSLSTRAKASQEETRRSYREPNLSECFFLPCSQARLLLGYAAILNCTAACKSAYPRGTAHFVRRYRFLSQNRSKRCLYEKLEQK